MSDLHTEILELRTGKPRQLGDTTVLTAIEKSIRHSPTYLGTLGFEGDEQAEEILHGGPDKAALHYAVEHYDVWRAELPKIAAFFRAGGFGENIVSRGLDETNVCIGDVFRIGSAIAQVTQPRQPCFKLNHRFHEPRMSRFAQESGRTGWYYRVLEPGFVQAGDEILLIERPWPEWPVRRLQRYLYADTMNRPVLEELADMRDLAEVMRQIFVNRLHTMRMESWENRLIDHDNAVASVGAGDRAAWRVLRIDGIYEQAPGVKSFWLVDPAGNKLEPFTPGAHVLVEIPGGLIRRYSLCNDSSEQGYEIAVRLAESSRGGSSYMHRCLNVGDALAVSPPRNTFAMAAEAKRHLMIAGGIGITPLMSMVAVLEREHCEYELHYCVKTHADIVFRDRLSRCTVGRIVLHATREPQGHRVDCAELLSSVQPGTHVYCCGPESLMAAVRDATCCWDPAMVHFEQFRTETTSDSTFFVKIASTGALIQVGPGSSILEALRLNGVSIPSDCEAGNCGTCRVNVLDGAVEHRDVVLTADERKSFLTTCVSRAKCGVITLNL